MIENKSKFYLSIVLPVYNVEGYLSDCLDSIINQAKVTFEIIAIDDASTDTSLEILQSYERKEGVNLTIIALEENKGAGYARNKALEVIRGEYIFFVDSDDLLEANAFQCLLSARNDYNSDLIVFKYSLYHHSSKNNYEKRGMLQLDEDKWTKVLNGDLSFNCHIKDKPMFLSSVNFPWNKIYKTAFVKRNLIKFTQTIVNNDIFFHWKSLILAEDITFIDESLYIHREFESGQQQQITNYFDERRFDMFLALEEVDDLMHSNDDFIEHYYKHFLLFKLDLLRWALARMPDHLREEFLKKTKKSMAQFSKRDFLRGAHSMPNVYSEMAKIKLATNSEFS